MKDWIYLPLGSVLAVLAGGATVMLIDSPGEAVQGAAREGELARTVAQLDETLTAMAERQAELERLVGDLAARSDGGAGGGRTEVGGLDAAVARWMQAHAPAAQGDERGAAGADDDAEIDRVIDRLLSDGFEGDEEQALWRELAETGLLDDVIAELAAIAEADPNDPDLQFELGWAYVQKIFSLGPGPMAAEYGQMADETFDRALELDETHWGARFTKALSLSNWPVFLGKTSEAIHQYEILRAQQEARPQERRFAQTYYFLGNLYQQTGETSKALDAWRYGLELFPDNETLLRQITVHERGRNQR